MKEKLELFKNFCEREYKDFVRAIEYGWNDIIQARNYALQRCIGVADFLQRTENIPFDDIDKIYMEYREKFYKITSEN